MKTIIIDKNHGCYESALIRVFESIAAARRSGYRCKDKDFVVDTRKDIMITEQIYSSDDMREQEEHKTFIKNSALIRVYCSDQFIDVYEIDNFSIPSMIRRDREIKI